LEIRSNSQSKNALANSVSSPALISVFTCDLVDKILYQIQHAVWRPDFLPQIRRAEILGPIGPQARRIARPTVISLVERQENRILAVNMCGDRRQVIIYRKMS
jgi:hypothetical protein